MFRRTALLAAAAISGLALAAIAQERKPGIKSDLDDLLDGRSTGTRFRLVEADAPSQGIDSRLYWRRLPGATAAATAPIRFRLGDTEIIAPKLNQENLADAKASYSYPTEGSANVPAGRYLLDPGAIPLEFQGGLPVSQHPAVKVVAGAVHILCAPLRLEAVDERGVPAPTVIRLGSDKGSLVREESAFSVLTLWLPVGGKYQTSFGTVVLRGDGKVDAQASRLAPGVEVTNAGLRKTVSAEPGPRPTAPAETVSLRATEGALEVFVPPMVAPGETLWMALSRKGYAEVAGRPLSPDQIICLLEDGAEGSKLPLQVGNGPAEAQRDVAIKSLKTTAEDVAWFSAALPEAMIGPVGLRLKAPKTNEGRATVLVAAAEGLQLIPHRWRTVFADTETAVYQLLIPRGMAACEAQVYVQAGAPDSRPVALARLPLPAVTAAYDARLFTLNMADLPPGKYRLWVEAGPGRSGRLPLVVVSWLARSPFLTHSMSGCTACWPTSDEGLEMLEASGLEMLSATGHNSLLDTAMPRIDPTLAVRLRRLRSAAGSEMPAELAIMPAANDRLLERLLARRLRLIDLTVCRAHNMYNEGLSYHHSYQPSVDRVIRRMQIFTQQTGDYASFWGVNYSWFPALFGYAEGGVPTDAHVADRNRVLAERVQEAGCPPLSKDERGRVTKYMPSPDAKGRAEVLQLVRKAVANWRASHELGWGRHNALYNSAVHEVRPDTVCTLFENAGHNEGKRIRAMFNAMNAQCYESYTDFGDWPISSAFVVDWSLGQSPGQPVWLTTCWGTSSEGKMKSLLNAFARGMAGGGVPMQGTFDLAELRRRGTGLQLVSQYGAVAVRAVPDRRVAILARAPSIVFSRAMWDAHAVYYHLTRLGYPPAILADEDILTPGVPDHVRVLVLVKERLPWEPELRRQVEAFLKRGGKLVAVGECAEPFDGAIAASGALKNLWDLKGFHAQGHQEMWREFTETWRAGLGEAMARAGLPALATTDPELGFAVTMDAGPVRYVAVIADAKGTHSNVFQPVEALPLSLEGAGWTVRDLVKQATLPVSIKDGRTETKVELVTEPTTLLALYRAEPAEVSVQATESPRLGSALEFQADVSAADARPLGPVPIRCTLTGHDGRVRADVFRAASERIGIPLAARDRAGARRLIVQELLTGRTATVEIAVAPPSSEPATIQPVGEVHVVNRDHVRAYLGRPGEKLVIVEPGQSHLRPMAQSLVDELNKGGVEARLWEVRPEDFDTQPVRFYPAEEDEKRLAEIEAGRRIGYREDLKAYIDKLKRAHDASRGGYSEIEPPWMVGRDAIVFSGGRLAESLRAVSPWLGSPNVPGRGQGRLVVCFSPFMANRHAVAVVANDTEGFAKAAQELVRTIPRAAAAPQAKAERADAAPLKRLKALKSEVQPVPRPYVNYTPIRRCLRLMANRQGAAAVLLRGDKDNLAMVDAQGKLTSVFSVDPLLKAHGRLDSQGRLLWPTRNVLKTHPGWGFPTEVGIAWQSIGPDGVAVSELDAYAGPASVPNHEGGVVLAEDGETGVLGRPGALRYRMRGDATWKRYDDTPYSHTRFGLLYPRQPVGVAFSPDGRYAVFTMDSRPMLGNMNQALERPTGCETVLLDLQTGQRVWALRSSEDRRSTYAVHSGFAAVARDGLVTALADFDGVVHLVDKAGKVLASQTVGDPGGPHQHHIGPLGGVAVRIADGGDTAVFAFEQFLVLANANRLTHVPMDGVVSADLSPDGRRVVVGLTDGRVLAMDPSGKTLWTATPGGVAPLVAAVEGGQTLAATGPGDLVRLDAQGQEAARTKLVEPAEGLRKPIQQAPNYVRLTPGTDYVEPPTLILAKEHFKARQVTAWKPTGDPREAFGRKFFAIRGRIDLSAEDAQGELLAHLVYRRPAENTSLTVHTEGAAGKETFTLDLPTPEYRVVDLPLRGPGARVAIVTEGPAEIAELSLWRFVWPGPNLAYIKPAGMESAGRPGADSAAGDILAELEGKASAVVGKVRNCRVWWPNTDVDAVRGPWLPAPIEPAQVVDGKRFGNGKLGAWANRFGHFAPIRGGFFTIEFGQKFSPGLVAVYDRSNQQSTVAASLAVFVPDEKDTLRGGPVLAGVVENDQFWRLLPVRRSVETTTLGVHLIREPNGPVGLSEVEVYR